MSVSSPLYKIKGDNNVKSLIIRLGKMQLTITNLEQAERVLNTITHNYQQFAKQQILSSFTIDAIMSYARCFIDGYGFKLSHSIFNNNLRPQAASNEITERDFHNLIINYRHKHLGHSDILLTVVGVGACKLDNEVIAVSPVVCSRVPHEDIEFYKDHLKLVIKAKQHLQPQLLRGLNELKTLIENGDAEITTEVLEFTPIPNDAKKMWGLE